MFQQMKRFLFLLLILLVTTLLLTQVIAQDDELPRAPLVDAEGGAVAITGEVTYTNPFFTAGVREPMVILEDQAGFVARDEDFLFPPESQVLGQITSDFFTSPFTYSISLPIEPQATLNDVDHDDEDDPGVMIYAVAYWSNTYGDPFLEERDQMGGGWSTAYASTATSNRSENFREIIGGNLLIYTVGDGFEFPSGFGEDGLLFTEDDPLVVVPKGYTVVNLDTEPFTFDRSRDVVIDLIEGEAAEADDFSDLSYTEAFDAMIEKMRREYAYTEYKDVDWDALIEEFRPMFVEAEANNDNAAYQRAMMRFIWAIPDGHHSTNAFAREEFNASVAGGLGMRIRELDDGRVIVTYLTEGGPAESAGLQLGTEILELNGESIADAISNTVPWSSPFSSPHTRRLDQLLYVIRFPVDSQVELSYRNPGGNARTTTLRAEFDPDSFRFTFTEIETSGLELPLEYEVLDNGYMYVQIFSFIDDQRLTIDLWERMITEMNENGVRGLIIDMRRNSGGFGFTADQMAAYFFQEELELGNTGRYDEDTGDFFFDEDTIDQFYLPPEDLRYDGEITVLVGPQCASACEFFTYDMTLQDRATVVGHYPTAGLAGGQEQFFMPDDVRVQFSVARNVDMDGNIIIEGVGVPPDIDVPVTEETLFAEGDPVLDAAVEHLDGVTELRINDGGEISIGQALEGELVPGERTQYSFTARSDTTVNIYVEDETGDLDTVLRIYVAGEDEPAAVNDDLGGSLNSGFEELEIPGSVPLILEVAGFNDAESGTYTITIEQSQ